MVKLVLGFLVIASIAVGGWMLAPSLLKERAADIARGVIGAKDSDIKSAVSKLILPEDPVKRREVLVQELKRNLEGMRYRIAIDSGEVTEEEVFDIIRDTKPAEEAAALTAALAGTSFEEFVGNTSELIKALEETNDDTGLSREVGERLLDTILPASAPIDCKAMCGVGE